MHPSECKPAHHCVCYNQPAIKKIASGIKEIALCEEKLMLTESLLDVQQPPKEKPMVFTPTFLVGSVVVSVSFGFLGGYLLAQAL